MNDDYRYSWKDRQREAWREADDFGAIRGILTAVVIVLSLALLAWTVFEVLKSWPQ